MDQVHAIRCQVLVEGGEPALGGPASRCEPQHGAQVPESERAEADGEQAPASMGGGADGASSGGVAEHVVSSDDGEAASDGYAPSWPIGGGGLRRRDRDGAQLRTGVEASASAAGGVHSASAPRRRGRLGGLLRRDGGGGRCGRTAPDDQAVARGLNAALLAATPQKELDCRLLARVGTPRFRGPLLPLVYTADHRRTWADQLTEESQNGEAD